MSKQDVTTVSVRIMDKEYQVACPPEEVDALTESARYLDSQMSGIRESGKIFGLDRIAVMAALNITNEYLHDRAHTAEFESAFTTRVKAMNERLDRVLSDQKQLNL